MNEEVNERKKSLKIFLWSILILTVALTIAKIVLDMHNKKKNKYDYVLMKKSIKEINEIYKIKEGIHIETLKEMLNDDKLRNPTIPWKLEELHPIPESWSLLLRKCLNFVGEKMKMNLYIKGIRTHFQEGENRENNHMLFAHLSIFNNEEGNEDVYINVNTTPRNEFSSNKLPSLSMLLTSLNPFFIKNEYN